MARVTLSIPEQHLREAVEIIRLGLSQVPWSPLVGSLKVWCADQETHCNDLENNCHLQSWRDDD